MTHATQVFLAAQTTQALLTFFFGAAALRVCPRPDEGGRICAWYLTGLTFAVSGGVATVLSLVGAAGVVAGAGTPSYVLTTNLQPPGNHARGFAVLGFAVCLALLCSGRLGPLTRRRVAAWVGVPLVLGALVGAVDNAFHLPWQYSMLAVVSGATVMVLFAALYVALVGSAMDWYLWVALAVYSVREALTSMIEAARASGFLSNDWKPNQLSIVLLGAASMVVMIACTLLRLGVLRAGREPPALLERLGA